MLLDYKTTVAILNWNGQHHLQTYLPSVLQHSEGAAILLIDNASTDGSVAWVKENLPSVEIVINPSNNGFTTGYNLGLKAVKTPYAILLNSDVEVSEGWLDPLFGRMESDVKIAACQPKVLSYKDKLKFEYAGASGGFIDHLGYPFCRGRVFNQCETDQLHYQDPREIFWATGACMMIRMSAFEEVNGLEEQFFAHMEEIDLCWRWHHQGYQIWVEPSSVVFHLGGGTLQESSPRKTYLNFRNGLTLLFINTLTPIVYFKILLRLLLDGVAGVWFLTKGQGASCLAVVQAHFSFYKNILYWKEKRKQNLTNFKTKVPCQLVYPKSIVVSFFALGKKKFSDLDFDT